MKKKTKPGAIQQLLSYAGNNKKQLYLSTFLATLGELFGMAPFITVSLLVAELFNKTATIQNVCILFAVALGGQILKLWLTYQSSFMSHKATYKILKNIRSKIADKMLRVPMGVMLDGGYDHQGTGLLQKAAAGNGTLNLPPRGKSAHRTSCVPGPVFPLPPLHTSPPSYRLYRLKKRLSHKSISYRKQHPFPDGAFYFYS